MQKNRSIIGKFHYTFVFTAIAQRLEKFLINDFRTLEGMKFRGFRLIPRISCGNFYGGESSKFLSNENN